MSNKDMARVVLQVAAEQTQLRKDFDKAQKTVETSTGKMAQASARAAKKMETDMTRSIDKVNVSMTRMGVLAKATMGGLFSGMAAGIAAGGFAGAIAGMRGLAASVAEVGERAKIAGVSVQAWQEWAYVSKVNRVEVDALQDGLKELNLRTSEFITTAGKSGSAAEAFQRLGYSVDELKTKIKDPTALLTEIIGKVEQLDKAAQIQIFDELFGGQGGEQFVKLIAQGEKGIRAQIQAAHDLEQVLADGVVQRADEVNRKFDAIALTIGGKLKSAVVDAFTYLDRFADEFRNIQDQADRTIQGNINRIMSEKQGVAQDIAAAKKDLDSLGGSGSTGMLRGQIKELEDRFNDLDRRENAAIAELEGRRSVMSPPKPASTTTTPATFNGGAPVSSGSSAAKTDEYKRATEAMREHLSVLQAETAAQSLINPLIDDYGFALEKARAKQDLLNAAKAAGKEITPQLAAEIDNLSTAYANATVESAKLAETQDEIRRRADEAREFNKNLTRGIVDGFVEGRKAADIFSDALKKVGERLMDLAFDSAFSGKSGGGLFGFIGGLFGGGGGGLFGGGGGSFPAAPGGLYADGGYTGAGGKWDPAGTVHKGEVVFSQADVARNGGVAATEALRMNGAPAIAAPTMPAMSQRGGSTSTTVSVPIHIDATGADAAGLARVERQLARLQAELPATVISTVKNAQSRRAL